MSDFHNPRNNDLNNVFNQLKERHGFLEINSSPISRPITIDFYRKWLAADNQGTMNYLSDHADIKENPKLLNEKFMTVISVSSSYLPTDLSTNYPAPARIALYAHHQDYHIWLKNKLKSSIMTLKESFPNEEFVPYVDSGPILERDWGYKNRLGWFGKNTCIIHPKHGSFFFLAEILTTLKLDDSSTLEPLPDFCGTCTRCITSCPTEAITSPHVIKADQCISYLTIESKTSPPVELRAKIGDWFFGCDICQSVCPWNEKIIRLKGLTGDRFSKNPTLTLSDTDRKQTIDYFQFIFTASNRAIFRRHEGTPLLRAGARGLRRNALIVCANQNLIELLPAIKKISDTKLEELKNWTIQQLESN